MDDMELLREYASRNSEEAFAALVSRHIDLVYSAALRELGNHHQAEEVTQAVFVVLARKARSLSPGTILPGWLFRTARLTAFNYLRTEIRRARREKEAHMQSNPSENPDDRWREVAPMLNDAIADLGENDRNAIVLRFLKGKDYKEVATALGGTEEAAQMRVSRALEKLRKLFAKRGVAVSAGVLAGLMTAHGTQAAPLGLAALVAASAVQGTTLTASTLTLVEGALKLMAWTKVKVALGASLVALLACQFHGNFAQARQLADAREDLRARNEAVAAQEKRIAELQQQTTAFAETRREQEQELARLRARRKAAGNGPQPKSAAGAPSTLLSALLQDPFERNALRGELVNGTRLRWEPLVTQLELNAEDADKLFQIGADWAMKNLETVAAFTAGTTTAEAAAQLSDQAEQDATNQVRRLLGEEAMAKFDECDRSFPARSLVEQFDKQLGFYDINAEQRQRLSQTISAEPFEVTDCLAGNFTVRELVFPEAMDRRFEEEARANQQILQNAAQFLTPDQLDALGLMQAYNLSAQKRTVLRMLWKF